MKALVAVGLAACALAACELPCESDVCDGAAGGGHSAAGGGGASGGGAGGGTTGGGGGGLGGMGGELGGGDGQGGGSGGSAGAGGGREPQPVTCGSAESWTLGPIGNGDMNPGLACRSCHSGKNFEGQNPTGAHAPFFVYRYMGTVFSSRHEANLCNAKLGQDVLVEILDADNRVIAALRPRYPSGNFYSVALPGTGTQPYRARVTAGGRTRQMYTLQTNGDCNACHTEQGVFPAPGRIIAP